MPGIHNIAIVQYISCSCEQNFIFNVDFPGLLGCYFSLAVLRIRVSGDLAQHDYDGLLNTDLVPI